MSLWLISPLLLPTISLIYFWATGALLMFCAARSMPTSLQSVGDQPMKDGFAWGSRGFVIICGANFGRVEQWWVSMSDVFFNFLSRLNISEKCQTSMVYEPRNPHPKKKGTNLARKHCDTSHLYQSIDCQFGAWDFVKKSNLFIDTQRRLIVLKDPQPKVKQLPSIRVPLGLESGPPKSPKNCGPEFPHELPGRKHSTTKGSGLLIPGIDSLLSAFVWIQLQHPQTPQ